MSLPRALFALGSAFALQGCVLAAAAVPVLAGGALVGSTAFGDRTRQAIAEGNEIDPESIAANSLAEYAAAPQGLAFAPAAVLPRTGAYADLLVFTNRAIGEREEAQSALLADPTMLQPERAPCEEDLPAVLIDLDPGEGVMALDGEAMPSGELLGTLEEFRRQGIAIAWMTDREPTDASRIRNILLETGLDPTARDPLFVQRFPGETKQARRRALLETHCLIAIAGDDRRDFDDVYTYVLDQSSTAPLEPMIGAGWFLISTPLD